MPEIHDEYGCSRHDGLIHCLGYKSGAAGVAATEGTEMHHIAEEIIKSKWTKYNFPAVLESGNQFTQEHKTIIVTYTNQIKKLYDDYYEIYGDDLELRIEEPIKIPELGIEISTIDALFIVPFELIHVVDLKTGVTPVAPTSAQMKGYILGALNVSSANIIRASIAQPKLQDELLTCEYSQREIDDHKSMMKLVLMAARREYAPTTLCKYCNWCVRNGECPSSRSLLTLCSINVEERELKPSALAILTRYAMDIEGIIGSLKQRAYALLESGARLPLPDGFELMLVDGRPTRVWNSEKKAEEMLRQLAVEKSMAPNLEDAEKVIFEVKKTMLSPSAAEKIFGKAKAISAKFKPLIFTKPGNKKLGIVKSPEEPTYIE